MRSAMTGGASVEGINSISRETNGARPVVKTASVFSPFEYVNPSSQVIPTQMSIGNCFCSKAIAELMNLLGSVIVVPALQITAEAESKFVKTAETSVTEVAA